MVIEKVYELEQLENMQRISLHSGLDRV